MYRALQFLSFSQKVFYSRGISRAFVPNILTQILKLGTLVNYLVSKILGKILGTEMLVDLENLGTR